MSPYDVVWQMANDLVDLDMISLDPSSIHVRLMEEGDVCELGRLGAYLVVCVEGLGRYAQWALSQFQTIHADHEAVYVHTRSDPMVL
jgi:hypothetical protein